MPFQDYLREHASGLGGLLGGGIGAGIGAGVGLLGGPVGVGAGATTGASLGTQLGALGGGLVGGLIPKTETPFQKEAREAQLSLLQQLKQQSPFQKVDFDPIRQQEISRFQQETIPEIAQRFASSPGQRGVFQKRLGEAGAGLAERLAALQAQHETGQQASQLAARGQEFGRLGQLQSFLQGDQLAAAQQQAARQGQLSSLLGLGQQIGQQQIDREKELREQLGRQYDRAGQYGTTTPGSPPPGLGEGLLFGGTKAIEAFLRGKAGGAF